MKKRHAISLVAAVLTCVGALASALAFSSSSRSYPIGWEFLTTVPLLGLQLLSAVTSWRIQVAPPVSKQLVVALLISAHSLFVGGATLLVLVVAGLSLASESRPVVLVLGALLSVLPLSSFLNARACWKAIFSSQPSANEA